MVGEPYVVVTDNQNVNNGESLVIFEGYEPINQSRKGFQEQPVSGNRGKHKSFVKLRRSGTKGLRRILILSAYNPCGLFRGYCRGLF